MLPAQGYGPFPLLIDVHGGPQSVAFVEFDKHVYRHVLCSRGRSRNRRSEADRQQLERSRYGESFGMSLNRAPTQPYGLRYSMAP